MKLLDDPVLREAALSLVILGGSYLAARALSFLFGRVLARAARRSATAPVPTSAPSAGTGSATIATITAAGIVAPLAPSLSANHLAMLVLAIGCGSLFFSHVNDAGFWLVKEYFGLTVGETIKSWSVMETVISVFGFALVMLASVLIT